MLESEKNMQPFNNDEIDIAKIISKLIDHIYLILAVTFFFSLSGVTYTFISTPIYRANALIQIESEGKNALVGDVSSFLLGERPSSIATEIALINSRMVLGQTITERNLQIDVKPAGLPLLGDSLQRLWKKTTPTISVSIFDSLNNINKEISLLVIDKQRYRIKDEVGNTLEGSIGKTVDGLGVKIHIDSINAPKGQQFTIIHNSIQYAQDSLRKALSVEGNDKTGGKILKLSLIGTDPISTEKTLNTLIKIYQNQNILRKSEESSQGLSFLKRTLPEIKSKLDNAEEKLNLFRKEHQSVDLSLEAKSTLEKLVSVSSQLNELTFREADISKLYTRDHPAYRALLEKRRTLSTEREQINQQVSLMPATQQEILRLTREVESGQTLYLTLLKKQQEFNILNASTVGDIRIIDSALVEDRPIKPKKGLIVLLTTILGFITGVASILLYYFFHQGIDTPDEVESLELCVFSALPHSDQQDHAVNNLPLALSNPTDITVEAFRALRTSLHFARLKAKNNVIAITGTAPGVGKSFVCTNMAIVMAQAGLRVILIDGDMRRGCLHKALKLNIMKGLSDILCGKFQNTEVVQNVLNVDNLSFISRGDIQPNPSELLMRPTFEALLTWACSAYDVVILDTPPILAVTDSIVACRHAGSIFLTVQHQRTTLQEIRLCVQRLTQSQIVLNGVLINNIKRKASSASTYCYYSYKSK